MAKLQLLGVSIDMPGMSAYDVALAIRSGNYFVSDDIDAIKTRVVGMYTKELAGQAAFSGLVGMVCDGKTEAAMKSLTEVLGFSENDARVAVNIIASANIPSIPKPKTRAGVRGALPNWMANK